MKALLCSSLLLALCLFLPAASGAEKEKKKKGPPGVGDVAPAFTLPDQNGKPVSLSDYAGKKTVVVAFFPKAFTGG